ncbi:MAG: TetR family transcriptional regulator [Candidatus Lokiarchaeota archaeon]|nr:TetR family transcriptional regulator [Candidatus Lokiarchaeota archaeon]MBD3337746.1 TetR family transcriptional regulator [Candidatus Lokiarchaeota archaeon]
MVSENTKDIEELSHMKRKILREAERLIIEKGYSNTSLREIARNLDISPGTVLYHFNNGKLEILREYLRTALNDLNLAQFVQDLDYDSFDETLRDILGLTLKSHRKYREFAAAIEIEILSKPDSFRKLLDLIKPEIQIALAPLKVLLKRFPDKNYKLEGKEKELIFAIDALTHRHIFYGNFFGSDSDLINLLVTVAKAILENDL